MDTLIPQQPYFLRALYEWCVDSGYGPHISVVVDSRCKVPLAYVRDGQIVLNIGPSAVRDLHIDNEWITFSARFSGVSQEVHVPVDAVLAIYARETGTGMAFQHLATPTAGVELAEVPMAEKDERPLILKSDQALDTETNPNRPKGRPSLKVVK